jgi:hypothetical protein
MHHQSCTFTGARVPLGSLFMCLGLHHKAANEHDARRRSSVLPWAGWCRLMGIPASAGPGVAAWMLAFRTNFFDDERLCCTSCSRRCLAYASDKLKRTPPSASKLHKQAACTAPVNRETLPYLPFAKGNGAFDFLRVVD